MYFLHSLMMVVGPTGESTAISGPSYNTKANVMYIQVQIHNKFKFVINITHSNSFQFSYKIIHMSDFF
jgi:hypothetical protein